MIVQNIQKLISLEEFSDWYPDGYDRYELRNGVIFEMQPTGTHEQLAGLTAVEIFV